MNDLASLFQRGTDLINVAFPAATLFCFAVGTLAFGVGKSINMPGVVQWGKNGWLGGVVCAAATGIQALGMAIGNHFR
jgi:hypothetical protein